MVKKEARPDALIKSATPKVALKKVKIKKQTTPKTKLNRSTPPKKSPKTKLKGENPSKKKKPTNRCVKESKRKVTTEVLTTNKTKSSKSTCNVDKNNVKNAAEEPILHVSSKKAKSDIPKKHKVLFKTNEEIKRGRPKKLTSKVNGLSKKPDTDKPPKNMPKKLNSRSNRTGAKNNVQETKEAKVPANEGEKQSVNAGKKRRASQASCDATVPKKLKIKNKEASPKKSDMESVSNSKGAQKRNVVQLESETTVTNKRGKKLEEQSCETDNINGLVDNSELEQVEYLNREASCKRMSIGQEEKSELEKIEPQINKGYEDADFESDVDEDISRLVQEIHQDKTPIYISSLDGGSRDVVDFSQNDVEHSSSIVFAEKENEEHSLIGIDVSHSSGLYRMEDGNSSKQEVPSHQSWMQNTFAEYLHGESFDRMEDGNSSKQEVPPHQSWMQNPFTEYLHGESDDTENDDIPDISEVICKRNNQNEVTDNELDIPGAPDLLISGSDNSEHEIRDISEVICRSDDSEHEIPETSEVICRSENQIIEVTDNDEDDSWFEQLASDNSCDNIDDELLSNSAEEEAISINTINEDSPEEDETVNERGNNVVESIDDFLNNNAEKGKRDSSEDIETVTDGGGERGNFYRIYDSPEKDSSFKSPQIADESNPLSLCSSTSSTSSVMFFSHNKSRNKLKKIPSPTNSDSQISGIQSPALRNSSIRTESSSSIASVKPCFVPLTRLEEVKEFALTTVGGCLKLQEDTDQLEKIKQQYDKSSSRYESSNNNLTVFERETQSKMKKDKENIRKELSVALTIIDGKIEETIKKNSPSCDRRSSIAQSISIQNSSANNNQDHIKVDGPRSPEKNVHSVAIDDESQLQTPAAVPHPTMCRKEENVPSHQRNEDSKITSSQSILKVVSQKTDDIDESTSTAVTRNQSITFRQKNSYTDNTNTTSESNRRKIGLQKHVNATSKPIFANSVIKRVKEQNQDLEVYKFPLEKNSDKKVKQFIVKTVTNDNLKSKSDAKIDFSFKIPQANFSKTDLSKQPEKTVNCISNSATTTKKNDITSNNASIDSNINFHESVDDDDDKYSLISIAINEDLRQFIDKESKNSNEKKEERIVIDFTSSNKGNSVESCSTAKSPQDLEEPNFKTNFKNTNRSRNNQSPKSHQMKSINTSRPSYSGKFNKPLLSDDEDSDEERIEKHRTYRKSVFDKDNEKSKISPWKNRDNYSKRNECRVEMPPNATNLTSDHSVNDQPSTSRSPIRSNQMDVFYEDSFRSPFEEYCMSYLRESVEKSEDHQCNKYHKVPDILFSPTKCNEADSKAIINGITHIYSDNFSNPPLRLLSGLIKFFMKNDKKNNILFLIQVLKRSVRKEKLLGLWVHFTRELLKKILETGEPTINSILINNYLKEIFEGINLSRTEDVELLHSVLEILVDMSKKTPVLRILACVDFLKKRNVFPVKHCPFGFIEAVLHQVLNDKPMKHTFVYKVYKTFFEDSDNCNYMYGKNSILIEEFLVAARPTIADAGYKLAALKSSSGCRRTNIRQPGRILNISRAEQQLDVVCDINAPITPIEQAEWLENAQLTPSQLEQWFETLRTRRDGSLHYLKVLKCCTDTTKMKLNDITMSFIVLGSEIENNWSHCYLLFREMKDFDPSEVTDFTGRTTPAKRLMIVIESCLKSNHEMEAWHLFIDLNFCEVEPSNWKLESSPDDVQFWKKLRSDLLPLLASPYSSLEDQRELLIYIMDNQKSLQKPTDLNPGINVFLEKARQVKNLQVAGLAVAKLVSDIVKRNLLKQLQLEIPAMYRVLVIAIFTANCVSDNVVLTARLMKKSNSYLEMYPTAWNKNETNIFIKTCLTESEMHAFLIFKFKTCDKTSNLSFTFEEYDPSEIMQRITSNFAHVDWSLKSGMERFKKVCKKLNVTLYEKKNQIIIDRVVLLSWCDPSS